MQLTKVSLILWYAMYGCLLIVVRNHYNMECGDYDMEGGDSQ